MSKNEAEKSKKTEEAKSSKDGPTEKSKHGSSESKATEKATEVSERPKKPGDEKPQPGTSPAAKAAPQSEVSARPVEKEGEVTHNPSDGAPKTDEREVLPHPDQVDVDGDPQSAAPPPKRAPAGDSRSMRRGSDFCLLYRHKHVLVRREGVVGKLGKWTVTQYPSMNAAAHAYAQECSDLGGAGFSDLRG